ncbi:hypothetical protein BHM03_00034239, partial [Ensete ventricosum]
MQGRLSGCLKPSQEEAGELPPSALGSLRSLRHVNLRNNSLFGSLPASLFAARQLQSLVLYGNFLSGSLPPEIGELLYLHYLDLSGNLFAGPIPSSLSHLKRLKVLVLSHNSFTGSLPLGFGGSLAGLEKLDLSYNGISGPIPCDIGNLTNLQGTLGLSHNRFSGSIPPSLGNLPEKVYIDLTYNNLIGPIPQNGALENRGPTAFIGNPGLCGPPLKNSCPLEVPSSSPFHPINYSPPTLEGNSTHSRSSSSSSRLSKAAVIAIVASDVVGIGLIALVFFYFYCKAIASVGTKEDGGTSEKRPKSRKECMCFRKEDYETSSDSIEHHELVSLERNVPFDLDGLLKASAFVLGKSGIGIVYKVVLDDGLTLAVRRLGQGGSQRFKEFQTEVEAIGKVRHPKYWKTGTRDSAPLSWEVRSKIMKGIAKGLAFLHEIGPKKYVHGDLKPNNVLLGLDLEPYISDFGVGRLANIAGGSPFLQPDRIAVEKTQSRHPDVAFGPITSKGSGYQAPEASMMLKPSQKWDVYSFGVILLELISSRSPLVLLETVEMDLVSWFQLCIEEKKPLSDVLDPFLAQELDTEDEIIAVLKIALVCVQANPEKRPSMRQATDTLDRLITETS